MEQYLRLYMDRLERSMWGSHWTLYKGGSVEDALPFVQGKVPGAHLGEHPGTESFPNPGEAIIIPAPGDWEIMLGVGFVYARKGDTQVLPNSNHNLSGLWCKPPKPLYGYGLRALPRPRPWECYGYYEGMVP